MPTEQHQADGDTVLTEVAAANEREQIYRAGYEVLLKLATSSNLGALHAEDIASVAREVDLDTRDSIERVERLRANVRNAPILGQVAAREAIDTYAESMRQLRECWLQVRSGQLDDTELAPMVRGILDHNGRKLSEVADRASKIDAAYERLARRRD